jgi:hypothetical protein
LPQRLTPPHDARNFVGFEQAAHARTQTELVPMLARAEFLIAADTDPAERPAAQAARLYCHLAPNYRDFHANWKE